jgi:hypothetical protein
MDSHQNHIAKEVSMAKLSLSRLEALVLGFEATQFRVGIDVHKKSYSLALLRLIKPKPQKQSRPNCAGLNGVVAIDIMGRFTSNTTLYQRILERCKRGL